MKALILHCNCFSSDDINSKTDPVITKNSIVVMITFELKDRIRSINKLSKEIKKISSDFDEKIVVIFPFAHLSNKLLDYENSLILLDKLVKKLEETNLEIKLTTFGTDKEILLSIIGHQGNALFRSF